SASPGTTARLTCTLSRVISVGGSNIYWIQQQPGSLPRDLLYYSSDSDKHQGSGVPSRFSGSKDALANAGLLRISGLQAEAEAASHWATAHGIGSSHRSSQRLREGGSETKSPGPTGLFSESLLLRNFCGGFCRGVSSVRRPVFAEEGQTHRPCCGLSHHRCPSRTPG
ncbi:PREDICTED: immunoglobulin omega chain-like, partial [Odobenus rosmarus divergens]